MNLEEFEAEERKAQSEKRPLHVVGTTALSIHTPGGHYMYVVDAAGQVERRQFPGYVGPDAHLGAVDA